MALVRYFFCHLIPRICFVGNIFVLLLACFLFFIFQPTLFFFLPLIVAFDEDFDAERSENHDARAEISLLAQSPDCEFTEVNPFRCY